MNAGHAESVDLPPVDDVSEGDATAIDFSKWQVPETSTCYCSTMLGVCCPLSCLFSWVYNCPPACGGIGDDAVCACVDCVLSALVCPVSVLGAALLNGVADDFDDFRGKFHMSTDELYSGGCKACRMFWYPDRMRRHVRFCHAHGWTPDWQPPGEQHMTVENVS